MIDGGLRRLFHKSIGCAFWQAVETGCVGSGVPDSHYIFHGGISGWVEYKKTKAFSIKFQPEQIAWIDRYIRYGGRCWIAVRQIREASLRVSEQDNLYLINGENVKLLNRQGLRGFISKEQMARLDKPGQTIIWRSVDMSTTAQVWSGGINAWDWDTIEKLLKT